MRIVVDTNVVISAVFFGGNPRKVVEAIVDNRIEACANVEIVSEYLEIVDEMISRKDGRLSSSILNLFVSKLNMIESVSRIEVSRDPDDDKFISCAVDAGALYIVSGDKDLLVLENYEGIQIVTAKQFCDQYLQ